jgi:SAM-dependent methyltransferase
MKRRMEELLICPKITKGEMCKGHFGILNPKIVQDEFAEGSLLCKKYGQEYHIKDGIPDLEWAENVFQIGLRPKTAQECFERSRNRYISPTLIDRYIRFAYGPYTSLKEAYGEMLYSKIASMASEVKREDVVLDIGCGVGRTAKDLTHLCDFVVGMDFSPAMVQKAREIVADVDHVISFQVMEEASIRTCKIHSFGMWQKTDFIIGDVLWIPYNDETFGCVLAVNLFDRVPHPERAIIEISRVLKSNGSFIATDPYDWDEDYTPRRSIEGKRLWLEKDDILNKLRNHGFTIEDSFDDVVFIEKFHKRHYQVFLNHAFKAKKLK